MDGLSIRMYRASRMDNRYGSLLVQMILVLLTRVSRVRLILWEFWVCCFGKWGWSSWCCWLVGLGDFWWLGWWFCYFCSKEWIGCSPSGCNISHYFWWCISLSFREFIIIWELVSIVYDMLGWWGARSGRGSGRGSGSRRWGGRHESPNAHFNTLMGPCTYSRTACPWVHPWGSLLLSSICAILKITSSKHNHPLNLPSIAVTSTTS